jgi:hypothetical protein
MFGCFGFEVCHLRLASSDPSSAGCPWRLFPSLWRCFGDKGVCGCAFSDRYGWRGLKDSLVFIWQHTSEPSSRTLNLFPIYRFCTRNGNGISHHALFTPPQTLEVTHLFWTLCRDRRFLSSFASWARDHCRNDLILYCQQRVGSKVATIENLGLH